MDWLKGTSAGKPLLSPSFTPETGHPVVSRQPWSSTQRLVAARFEALCHSSLSPLVFLLGYEAPRWWDVSGLNKWLLLFYHVLRHHMGRSDVQEWETELPSLLYKIHCFFRTKGHQYYSIKAVQIKMNHYQQNSSAQGFLRSDYKWLLDRQCQTVQVCNSSRLRTWAGGIVLTAFSQYTVVESTRSWPPIYPYSSVWSHFTGVDWSYKNTPQ